MFCISAFIFMITSSDINYIKQMKKSWWR